LTRLEDHSHSEHAAKTDVSGPHNRFLDDSLAYIKDHPGRVVATAALAVGSIAFLRARAIPVAEQEIGALANAAERGLGSIPKNGAADALSKLQQASFTSAGEAGLNNSFLHRAIAENPNIMQAPPWNRNSAIKGTAEYLNSRFSAHMPEGTDGIAKYAWMHREAADLKPEVVNTVSAVTRVFGKEACGDFETINRVAANIGPRGHWLDYIGSFQSERSNRQLLAESLQMIERHASELP
jgi:hypothetical protein